MSYILINCDTGVVHDLIQPGKTTIGRGENNTIRPDSKSVSKTHAELEIFPEDYKPPIIRDFQSRNGTFIGRNNPLEWQKVSGGKDFKLNEADSIRFGNASPIFIFRYESEEEVQNKADGYNQLDEIEYDDDGLPIAAPSPNRKRGGGGEDRDHEASSPPVSPARSLSPSRNDNLSVGSESRRNVISIEYPAEATTLRVVPTSSSPSSFRSSNRFDEDDDEEIASVGSRSRSPHKNTSKQVSLSRQDDYTDRNQSRSSRSPQRDSSRQSSSSRQDRYERENRPPDNNSHHHSRSIKSNSQSQDERRRAIKSDGYIADDTLQLTNSKLRSGRSSPSRSADARSFRNTGNTYQSNERNAADRYQRRQPHPNLRSGAISSIPGLSGISGGLGSGPQDPPPPVDQGSAFAVEQTDLDTYMEKTGFGSFLPRSSLTLPERRAVEAQRQKAADEVMRANKALSGAIKYSDWKKESDVVHDNMNRENDRSDNFKNALNSAAGADLQAPPEDACSSEIMKLVEDVLGLDGPAEETAFFYEQHDEIEPIISEAVVLEALAEGLLDQNQTVVGRLESVVQEIYRVYQKSHAACLINDYDDMVDDLQGDSQGDGKQPSLAVIKATETLAFACDTIKAILDSGLMRSLIEAEVDGMASEDVDKPVEGRRAYFNDRMQYGQRLMLLAYEAFAGQELDRKLGAMERLERLASHGGSALVTEKSVLNTLVPSQQHAVIANTMYPILLGLRSLLKDIDSTMTEIEQVDQLKSQDAQGNNYKSIESGHTILNSFNEEFNADGELRLSRSMSIPVKDGDKAPLSRSAVSAIDSHRVKVDRQRFSEHMKIQMNMATVQLQERLKGVGVKLPSVPASALESQLNRFRKAMLLWSNPHLRHYYRAWLTWKRNVHIMKHQPELFDPANADSKISKRYHDEIVKKLKFKVDELSERLREIAVVSDTDAALIAEKALNRELTTSNIMLREEVHLLRAQILDLSASHLVPVERERMLRDMLDRADEFSAANREIRALREQLSRLHGQNPDVRANALKKGDATPARDCWGTIPPKLHELRAQKVTPAPMEPVSEPQVDGNGKPILRRRRPWTKAQCKLLSRDDARRIVLEEVRRLRQSFVDVNRERERLKERLADESARCVHLQVSLHTLQERYMDKEYRLNQMQDILSTQKLNE